MLGDPGTKVIAEEKTLEAGASAAEEKVSQTNNNSSDKNPSKKDEDKAEGSKEPEVKPVSLAQLFRSVISLNASIAR
jgi:hypothetical protein